MTMKHFVISYPTFAAVCVTLSSFCHTALCQISSSGTSFTLTVPPAATLGDNRKVLLTVCTLNPCKVDVNVTGMPYPSWYSSRFTVSLTTCRVVDSISTTGVRTVYGVSSSTWLSYLQVKASYPVSVQLMVSGTGAFFTALPDESLDTNYYALTLDSTKFAGRSVLVVTAVEPAVVNVTLPFSNTRCFVTLCDGSCLANNVNLTRTTFNVSAGQSICVASPYDLSGSFVSGSKPLSLVAGNIRLASNDYYVFAQMLPTSVWSALYFVPPLPSRNYWLEIYSEQTTSLSVFRNVDTATSYSGKGFAFWINFTDPYFISSDESVMAIGFSYGSSAGAILLQSVDSTQPKYSFVIPPSSSTNLPQQQQINTLALTYYTDRTPDGHVCINFKNISTAWRQSNEKYYWYTLVTVEHSASYVVSLVCNQSTQDADWFGAYLYFTNSTDFLVGFPLAFCWSTPVNTNETCNEPASNQPELSTKESTTPARDLSVVTSTKSMSSSTLTSTTPILSTGLPTSASKFDNSEISAAVNTTSSEALVTTEAQSDGDLSALTVTNMQTLTNPSSSDSSSETNQESFKVTTTAVSLSDKSAAGATSSAEQITTADQQNQLKPPSSQSTESNARTIGLAVGLSVGLTLLLAAIALSIVLVLRCRKSPTNRDTVQESNSVHLATPSKTTTTAADENVNNNQNQVQVSAESSQV